MPEVKKEMIKGFSQGVRENSAVRMMKLAAPVCPNSQRIRQSDGSFKEQGQNCQLAGGKWWLMCEELGHDPYHRTRVWYETVDEWDTATGELTGTKKLRREAKELNVVQVPIGRRYHSGMGVVNSMERKGRRRLRDLGYEEVCQFRNCQRPIDPKAISPAFGQYCSRQHLALVAADQQQVMLQYVVPQLDGGTGQSSSMRAKQLREALAGAEVDVR